MKSRILSALAPTALFISNSAIAAPVGGYDNWTVSSGVITATCPAGHTCTNLDATGNGILQQRMVDNSDSTVSYFRTIITDEGVTATNAASVSALGFRSEGMIGLDGGGGNNYATRGIVRSPATFLGNDDMATMSEISLGALRAGSIDASVHDMEINMGDNAHRTDFHFQEGGIHYFELNYGTSNTTPSNMVNAAALAVRRTGGLTAAGTLTLDPSGTPQTLAYVSGGSVTAVWLTEVGSSVGTVTNQVLGLQRYTAITNNGKTNVGGTSLTRRNVDGAGNFVISLNAPDTEISDSQWGWNTSLFGARPQQYFTNSLANGIRAPDAPGIFANTYLIP